MAMLSCDRAVTGSQLSWTLHMQNVLFCGMWLNKMPKLNDYVLIVNLWSSFYKHVKHLPKFIKMLIEMTAIKWSLLYTITIISMNRVNPECKEWDMVLSLFSVFCAIDWVVVESWYDAMASIDSFYRQLHNLAELFLCKKVFCLNCN